jgi:hypothetical protein
LGPIFKLPTMLTTAALGDPGVCVYRWQGGALKPVAQLSPFGAGAGATSVALNCNNQVVASASTTGDVVLGLPEEGRPPLYAFATGTAGQEVRAGQERKSAHGAVLSVAPENTSVANVCARALIS